MISSQNFPQTKSHTLFGWSKREKKTGRKRKRWGKKKDKMKRKNNEKHDKKRQPQHRLASFGVLSFRGWWHVNSNPASCWKVFIFSWASSNFCRSPCKVSCNSWQLLAFGRCFPHTVGKVITWEKSNTWIWEKKTLTSNLGEMWWDWFINSKSTDSCENYGRNFSCNASSNGLRCASSSCQGEHPDRPKSPAKKHLCRAKLFILSLSHHISLVNEVSSLFLLLESILTPACSCSRKTSAEMFADSFSILTTCLGQQFHIHHILSW